MGLLPQMGLLPLWLTKQRALNKIDHVRLTGQSIFPPKMCVIRRWTLQWLQLQSNLSREVLVPRDDRT